MPRDTQSDTTHLHLPVLVDDELQCERCAQREREGMLHCTRRDCPYIIVQHGPVGCPVNGLVLILVLLFPFVIPVLGIYKIFGHSVTLFNPTHGAMSRQTFLFGREVGRTIIIPTEKLAFPPAPFATSDNPVSAAMVRHEMRGSFSKKPYAKITADELCAVVLADLANRDYISVWRADVLKRGIWEKSSQQDYIFLRGTAEPPAGGGNAYPESSLLKGLLEQKLLMIIEQWPTHLVKKWRNRGPNAYMLVYLMFDRKVDSPSYDLAQIADLDARHHKGQIAVQALQDQAQNWYKQLAADHPDFISVTQKQIRKAIEDRTYVEYAGP